MNKIQNHTKGPWARNSDGRVEDPRGATVAQCYVHSFSAGRALECAHNANAERIVECVNACEGLENPAAIPDALEVLRDCLRWINTTEYAAGSIMPEKIEHALAALGGPQK